MTTSCILLKWSYKLIMQAEANGDNSQKNKQILFIVIIYLTLTLTSHFTSINRTIGKPLIEMIQDEQLPAPSSKQLLSIFSNENYEGIWNSNNTIQNDFPFTKDRGKFKLRILKYGQNDRPRYETTINMNDGQYIDSGNIVLNFKIQPDNWQPIRNGTEIHLKRKKFNQQTSAAITQQNFTVSYEHDLILHNVQNFKFVPDQLMFVFKYDQQTNAMKIGIRIVSQQISATMAVARQESNMLSIITFAIVLFFISYMQFSAIMSILKGIIDGEDQPINYSIITVLVSTMWDATLCLVSFIEAFKNQQNLILFIMPAFLLCLLFTNLQLRLLLFIFQANMPENNLRQLIGKFNLMSYGSLVLLYPIIYYTNLSASFFLMISLIFLPQIYLNGINGRRPNISSPYYMKFLPTRFIIILYMKCFPWNIFQYEPDYILGFGCLSLLCLQMFWLWLQKIYGPRRVLPRFIMPESYNYDWIIPKGALQQQQNVHIELNQQEQCPICLEALKNDSDLPVEHFHVSFKLMRTPCGHKFHGSCLTEWMEMKLECPKCRAKLPAYD